MMELVERFVEAVESIAANMEVLAGNGNGATLSQVSTDTPAKPTYPAEDNRDAWLELCKVRGIEVPARTKTVTLVKWVKNWDIAHPEGGESEDPTTDNLGQGSLENEEDPFGSGSSSGSESDPFSGAGDSPTEEPVTREQVLDALQKIQKDKGNPEVISILQKAGGVDKLKDLSEDKYAAVYKEAVNG